MCSGFLSIRMNCLISTLVFCSCVTSYMMNTANCLERKGIANSTSVVFDSTSTNMYTYYGSSYSDVSSLCKNISRANYKQHHDLIQCYQGEILLAFGHCATFNEQTETISISGCPYLRHPPDTMSYNVSSKKSGYIVLPRNLSQLNDYMCGPLNRQGLVCSQCADGYGPSFTSFGYRCVNCSDTWYGVPLFLLLEFGPITVLYLIILVLQISVTSAPMPCFIMYAQLIVLATSYIFDKDLLLKPILFNDAQERNLTLDVKVALTFYGIFNLDFLHFNTLPPLCLSSHVKFIDLSI